MGLVACVASFVITFLLARRSLVWGIISVLVAGYLYGILRANIRHPASHFFADAAVGGLFAAQLFLKLPHEEKRRIRPLLNWVLVLAIWPTLLLIIPVQHYLVQLVGYRGAVLVLGFLILGARLSGKEWYSVAVGCAVLNLVAFGVALAEYQVGIEPFFPESEVTRIMYQSRVLVEAGGLRPFFRIPSSFSSAHAYGGTMVMTMPLLLGAWVETSGQGPSRNQSLYKLLFASAIGASVLGVFMSATRQHALMLFVVILAATLGGRIRMAFRVGWVMLILVVAVVVARDARLQRFTALQDSEDVMERVQISVNKEFLDYAIEYPMGNGLGGGGTSMPYFLQARVNSTAGLENEYGRIMLEEGIPGLVLWVGFIVWLALQGAARQRGPWSFGRRLAWVVVVAYFSTAAIGLGLMASIPQSYIFFLLGGWIAIRPRLGEARSRLSPVSTPTPGAPLLRAS